MELVDIATTIRSALGLRWLRLDERRIRPWQAVDNRPWLVMSNASQLEQLFLNLCLNALEAMDSDGELTVRMADLSDGSGSTLLVGFPVPAATPTRVPA